MKDTKPPPDHFGIIKRSTENNNSLTAQHLGANYPLELPFIFAATNTLTSQQTDNLQTSFAAESLGRVLNLRPNFHHYL